MKLILATALIALSLAGCAGGGVDTLAGSGGNMSSNSRTWTQDIWRDVEHRGGG